MKTDKPPLRPRDLAMLLLASRDLRPRQRARDQQADRVGLELKRRLLRGVADSDPEPSDLEAALLGMIDELGPPHGPTRAIAAVIREEWAMACNSPEWVSQLLSEATTTLFDNVGQAFQPDGKSQAFQPDGKSQAGKPDLHGSETAATEEPRRGD